MFWSLQKIVSVVGDLLYCSLYIYFILFYFILFYFILFYFICYLFIYLFIYFHFFHFFSCVCECVFIRQSVLKVIQMLKSGYGVHNLDLIIGICNN